MQMIRNEMHLNFRFRSFREISTIIFVVTLLSMFLLADVLLEKV